MKLVALFLFSWLMFVPEVSTNKTNADADKDILQDLEAIYGQETLQLSFFSIEELRPYTILQFPSTVSKYSNNWVAPYDYLSLLNEKERSELNDKIYSYLQDFDNAKKDKIFTKIVNYLYTYSVIERLFKKADDNYKVSIYKSLRNMDATRSAFDHISTLGEFNIASLEKSDFNQAKIKSYNIISDLSEKARLIYYSEFFKDVSEKVY